MPSWQPVAHFEPHPALSKRSTLPSSGMWNETDTMEDVNITRRFDDCDGRECSYGLIYSQQMMEVMSAWGPLIYAGCFAATLSSAIGSLEGAPRVFQAISKDKLLPGLHFFAKGRGVNNDPIRGYFLVTAIALVCLAHWKSQHCKSIQH
jgi:amino acid transporter